MVSTVTPMDEPSEPFASFEARLSEAEAALRAKREAGAEVELRRAELETRLTMARVAEAHERERRARFETEIDTFGIAQQFAAAARGAAEVAGESDRAEHERMVEERAAYEATMLRAQLAQQVDSVRRVVTEREEFERLLAHELRRQARLTRDGDEAAAKVTEIAAEIARTREPRRPEPPRPKPPTEDTVVVIARTILGLFARRPPKK
jgi:hypothetical protein